MPGPSLLPWRLPSTSRVGISITDRAPGATVIFFTSLGVGATPTAASFSSIWTSVVMSLAFEMTRPHGAPAASLNWSLLLSRSTAQNSHPTLDVTTVVAAQPFWQVPPMQTSPLPVHSPTLGPACPLESHEWISLPTHIVPPLQRSIAGPPSPKSPLLPLLPLVPSKPDFLLPQATTRRKAPPSIPRERAFIGACLARPREGGSPGVDVRRAAGDEK